MKTDLFRLEIEKGIATIWIDSKKDRMNIVSPSLIELLRGISLSWTILGSKPFQLIDPIVEEFFRIAFILRSVLSNETIEE